MPDITSLFEEYLGSPLASGSPPAVRQGYISGAQADTGLTPEFTEEDLLNFGSSNPLDTIAQATGRSHYMRDSSNDRDDLQVVGDASIDIVNGLLQGGLGIGAMGAGFFDADAGAAVSDFAGDVNTFAQGLQSDELNARREAFGARNKITTEHNDELERQEIADGDSPFIAGLRKVGRNFIRGFTNQDSVTFGSGVSSGVGSLLAGGVIGKGLRALNMGRAAMPTAIGMLEGGGAYQQTVNEVLAMDHDQLLKTSPEYAEMISNGIPWEEARNTIANEAGLMAGAIQAPVGVASGALVSKFEAAPFAVGSLRGAASNILRETVEEGIQSGSGEFTSNLGIRTFADENRRLDEGIGSAVAEGALYGMGTAGAVQAPGVIVQTPIRAAKATGGLIMKGARKAGAAITARLDQIDTELEKESPLNAEELDTRATEIADLAAMPGIREDINEALTADAQNEQEAGEAQEYVDRVFERLQIQPGEEEVVAGERVRSTITGSSDRLSAMRQVADIAGDTSADINDRIDAAVWLIENSERNADLFTRDIPEVISRLKDDDDRLAPLGEFEQIINHIRQHPEIQKAIRTGIKMIEQINAEEVASNPQTAEIALRVAEVAPDKAKLHVTETALKAVTAAPARPTQTLKFSGKFANDADDVIALQMLDAIKAATGKSHGGHRMAIETKAGMRNINYTSIEKLYNELPAAKLSHRSNLPPERRARIVAVIDMLRAAEQHERERQLLNEITGRDATNVVHDEILTNPADPKTRMKSGAAHFSGILQAMRARNAPVAKARLEDFMLFAQHMANKVQAINENYRMGNGGKQNATKYQALSPTSRSWFTPQVGLWINPARPKSVAQAKLVESEARAIIALANRIAALNPELGVKPLAEAALDTALQGSIEEVVRAHRNENRSQPAQSAQPTQSTETKIAAEPAPEPEAQAEVAPAPEQAEPEGQPIKDEAPSVEAEAVSAQLAEAVEAPAVEVKAEPVSKNEPIEPTQAAKDAARRMSDDQLNRNLDRFIQLKADGKATPRDEANFKLLNEEMTRREDEAVRAAEEAEEKEVEEFEDSSTLQLTENEIVQPEVEETSAEPKSVQEAWPDLVDSEHTPNRFWKAFKLPKTKISRLVGLNDVIGAIRTAVQSQETAERFVGGKLNNLVKPEVTKAFNQMFIASGNTYRTLTKTLNTLLASTIDGKTFEQALLEGASGNPVNTLKNTRALNLVRVNDGKVEFDDNLISGVLLAGLNWILNAGPNSRNYDDEAISEIIYGHKDGAITDEDRKFFNGTLYLGDVLDNLVGTITRYWGVQANNSIETGDTRGIPETLAKDLLRSYEKLGLIEIKPHSVGSGANKKSFNGVIIHLPDEIRNGVKGFPDLIEHLVAIEPEEIVHIGTPPEPVTSQRLAGKMRALPKQQREVAEIESQTPHRFNMPMFKLVSGLGKDLTLRLFGHSNLDDPKLNETHKTSLEGFNRTIAGAFEFMESLAEQVRNKAELAGETFEKMSIFFGYEFSRVNRMHMQGRYNPQANKLMRELVMPTESTIDLSSQTGADYAMFLLAIAQHLGEKVHRIGRRASIKAAETALQTQYPKSVRLLRDWVKRNGTDKPLKLNQGDIDTLLSELGPKPAPGAVHAILDYARYLEATSEQRKAFQTSLYLEADGITDGVVNALMHLVTGAFSEHWLRMMAKGGLYLGSKFKTLADYVNSGEPGSGNDLYQTATNALIKFLSADRVKQDGNTKVGAMRQAMLYAFNFLNDDVSFDIEQELLELARGIAKNPMTVTVYGSGARGIANKLRHALLSKLYEQMSTGELDHNLVRAINALTQNKTVLSKGINNPATAGKMYVFPEPDDTAMALTKSNFVKYKFTRGQLNNLATNIEILFVGPMVDSINAVIGEVNTGKTAMQKAIQIQSIVLREVFAQKIQEKIAEKKKADPSWRSHQSLSRAEFDAIHAEVVEQFAGLIPTGTQIFYPAATEDAEINNPFDGEDSPKVELTRSTDEKLGTFQLVPGPGDAGVRGIPYMIIGPGDGQMIQNIIASPDRPKGALYVFDGVNLKLTTVEQDSRVINEAVLKGWLEGNPLAAVAKSFLKFADAADKIDLTNMLSPAAYEQLASALGAANGEGKDPLNGQIFYHARQLEQLALQNQARKNALARINLSVDHMASAESPHVVSDKLDMPDSFEGQLELLNRLYREELAKLTGEEAPAEESEGEARITDAKDLNKLFVELQIPADQIALMSEVAAIAAKSGWSFVTGSRAQIAKYLKDNRPRSDVDAFDTSLHGVIHPETREIFILDPTAETVLHETIHAATYGLLQQYYANPKSLSRIQREAIERIEQLANEFYKLREPTDAYVAAYEAMDEHLQKGNQAAALNEFMAWVLANPELRELAKKTKVKNPLARIAQAVWEQLKNLFWSSAPKAADDLLSNLQFNTRVLTNTLLRANGSSVGEIIGENLRHQSSQFGRNNRLIGLRTKFEQKMANLIQADPAERPAAEARQKQALKLADEVLEGFTTKGFRMSPLESSTFHMMVAAFATQMDLDPNALVRISEIYNSTVKKLSVEDFMVSSETDFESVRDADRYYAQEKFNAIMGIGTAEIDAQNRSTLMSGFLALAMVNDQFREILSKQAVPKSEKSSDKTLDARLENLGISLLDELSTWASGEGRNQPNVQIALDRLTDRLLANATNDRNIIEQFSTQTGNAIDKANSWIVDWTQKLSGEAYDRLAEVSKTTDSKPVKWIAQLGSLMAAIINEDRGAIAAQGLVSGMNRMKVLPKFLHDGFNEIIGRTESNALIYDMIKWVRSAVQQTRQQFREHLPEQILKQFTRKLEDSERAAMTLGLAKTDLAALIKGFSLAQIMALLKDPSTAQAEIDTLEERLQGMDANSWPLWHRKAQELARYMVEGIPSANLLRNAWSIAHLYDELTPAQRKAAPPVTQQTIDAIDQLVSLYAFQRLDKGTTGVLSDLVENEAEGMDFVLGWLIGLRKDEQTKTDHSMLARINGFKGHVPTEGEAGSTLIVAEDNDFKRLRLMGFQRVADYTGSSSERGAPKRGYYFAPVSGKSQYNQGIMQNVRATASGVDPNSGFAVGIPMGGQIIEPSEVRLAKKALFRNTSTEALLPVRDQDGDIVAFERAMDPVQMTRLKQNQNLDEVMGMWAGRQVEEIKAREFNQVLISRLAAMWNKEKATERDQYINLFSKEARQDRIYRDAVNLFTPEARSMIANHFNEGEFWVRRDMINDAVGYRSASLGDAWTGNSRLPPEVLKQARRIATAVFGVDAYKRIVQAEKIYETFITDARVTIVVKSVVVPMANIMSNVVHLASRGVPMAAIFKGFTKKTAEVDAYVKGRLRKIEIDGLLTAARGRGNLTLVRKLKSEKKAIEDDERRMSIWPLIEAGEFASISDAAISREEINLSEGRLSAYMENLTNKLPDELKTAARYGIVSRDTALFKGLQRAVEYGDFLAKATLYDDLTKRQKKSKEYALARITEEFVNYDRLPGRTRGKLENMGLMWFWHFKLRSLKIAMATVRNNPLHLFLTSLVPIPDILGSVGTPVTDNIVSVGLDGRLDYSLGIDQATRAHQLNPWWNLWT